MEPETPPAVGPDAPAPAPATGFAPPDWLKALMADPLAYVRDTLMHPEFLVPVLIQLSAILAVLIAGVILTPPVRRVLMNLLSRLPPAIFTRIDETTPRLIRPALWAGLFWIAQAALAAGGQDNPIVRVMTSLATAWLIIRAATTFLPYAVRKPVAWVAWVVAALNALGILGAVVSGINSVGVPYGSKFINAGFIVKAVLTAAVFLYGAHWLSRRLKLRVDTLPKVEPSLRILLGHAIQIGLFIAAAILTLAGLGIPLSGLAVLGGAIGIGVGFGMQQIVANFISGVILLTDRSIKPDDVIEVDDTYGVVKSLGLRYASVITRDGKEHLIPNEQLVTSKVVNWSYSNTHVRVKRRLRVEYETDLRTAVRLVEEAARSVARVLDNPTPRCLVMEFGDEAIELEVRFWVDDPHNGVNNVGSDVMLAVWDKFRENGIDIPMRHQDVLITDGSTLKVEMIRARPKGGEA